MDVIKRHKDVVMVERHGAYFMGPLIARLLAEGVPADQAEMLAYARNYGRLEPDCMFALDSTGIKISKKQGRLLAEAEIPIEVIGSRQARGPDTGLFICEGYQETSGNWPPFKCHAAIDYPTYEYEVVHQALCEVGEACVAQWLNYQRPSLITSDKPASFKGRILGFIEDLFRLGSGTRILTTHFEAVTLLHGLLVEGKQLGELDDNWAPDKNSGVILWYEAEDTDPPSPPAEKKLMALDYRPDLTLVAP
ncbi:MAG: hypothetical protein HQ530_02675 [Parcubacteria group bacterium]|nr:hypothetical protein [Parcubacteria group bacterium]